MLEGVDDFERPIEEDPGNSPGVGRVGLGTVVGCRGNLLPTAERKGER